MGKSTDIYSYRLETQIRTDGFTIDAWTDGRTHEQSTWNINTQSLTCGGIQNITNSDGKKVREKSRECHNHKPQPFSDPKRKRKPTNLNKHKPNKRTKSTKISSLFSKRGNRNTKRTDKHKNKMTHGKTYNKSPRRINHKATRSKTNTGTTTTNSGTWNNNTIKLMYGSLHLFINFFV